MDRTQDEVVKVLKDARKLIKKGWTQGDFARDAADSIVEYEDAVAVKFCPLGALGRVGAEFPDDAAYEYLRGGMARLSHRQVPFVAQWNDSPRRTKSQVLKAFDLAIKLAS